MHRKKKPGSKYYPLICQLNWEQYSVECTGLSYFGKRNGVHHFELWVQFRDALGRNNQHPVSDFVFHVYLKTESTDS